jgi:hypothetical protein
MWVIIKHIYVCVCNDVNKGRQRNVEQKKKKEEKEIRWSFLNRALHCNTHKRWDENSRHAKKKKENETQNVQSTLWSRISDK